MGIIPKIIQAAGVFINREKKGDMFNKIALIIKKSTNTADILGLGLLIQTTSHGMYVPRVRRTYTQNVNSHKLIIRPENVKTGISCFIFYMAKKKSLPAGKGSESKPYWNRTSLLGEWKGPQESSIFQMGKPRRGLERLHDLPHVINHFQGLGHTARQAWVWIQTLSLVLQLVLVLPERLPPWRNYLFCRQVCSPSWSALKEIPWSVAGLSKCFL